MERRTTLSPDGGGLDRVHRLRDGTRVRLRAIGPADRRPLVAGFERLSPETRYKRFFSAVPRLPEALLARLLDTDGWNHLAIGAERLREDGSAEEALVGVARFIRSASDPASAETSVAVADELQHQGLGTLLLAALSDAARARGVQRFSARVLAGNAPMNALLRGLGAGRPRREDGQLLYDFELPRRAA
jgi:GNAT superfamily N-acetyltransferase